MSPATRPNLERAASEAAKQPAALILSQDEIEALLYVFEDVILIYQGEDDDLGPSGAEHVPALQAMWRRLEAQQAE